MHPIFHIFGAELPAYGTCMAVAFLTAVAVCYFRAPRYKVSFEDALIVVVSALVGALVFGKLLYIAVTFTPAQLKKLAEAGKLGLLMKGGIVFYGGLIGGAALALLARKITKCDFHGTLSALVPIVPLAHAIGRVGCTLAGCCYGMEYSGPFAISFPAVEQGITRFPVQPLEAILNLCLSGALLWYTRRGKIRRDVLAWYLAGYAVVRFILEFFRGDAIRGVFGAFSTSQWISIGLLAVSALWFWAVHRKPVKAAA